MADDAISGELFALRALSPVDGRYAHETAPLQEYFSEFALLRERVRVEIAYLLALSQQAHLIRPLTDPEVRGLNSIADSFSTADASRIKVIERTTRHDLKAVEYFMRDRLADSSLRDVVEWLHWGLTSEDINLLAQAKALADSRDRVVLPALDEVIGRLARLARAHKAVPMLARTHGQPAVPTTLGKELVVFFSRLKKARARLAEHRFEGKLGGAVGNWNALAAAAPDLDWAAFSSDFVRSFGLTPNLVTTQLLPFDNWITYLDHLRLTNSVLIDLAQDLWRYVSDDYLKARVVAGEVGSSTMPQKVNPIDLENAEGNLGVANALLAHYAQKLPVSRLQRDLSDSTVRRTFGPALGHTLVAYINLARGLDRVDVNEDKLRADLLAHWEVVSEGAQTILRAAGIGQAYETLKALTRGQALTRETYVDWVSRLDVSESVKGRLMALTPLTYTGLAEAVVERALADE